MRQTFVTILRLLVAVAAISIAAAALGGEPADATGLWPYPHSCYAGCCLTCQGGLCCFDVPPVPNPDDVPEANDLR